jgi:hypothetical protein
MLSKTWEGSSWKLFYLFFLNFFLLSVIHILILPDEKISMGWVFVSGRVQGTFGYLGVGCMEYWTAVGTSDRLFCFTQTKNVRHL